jgi:glycerol-3-phosphate acyltransferase PlsY
MSVILVIFSYLLGSVSFGYLIAKRVKNVDIRKMGSGNTGATNISRVLGIKYALIVFALDLGKGLLAVLLAKWLLPSPWVTIFCAYGVLLGHNWPLYFSFKGGRGAATALGIFFGIMPIAALIVFGIIIVIILVARYVSVASITGAINRLNSVDFPTLGRPTIATIGMVNVFTTYFLAILPAISFLRRCRGPSTGIICT